MYSKPIKILLVENQKVDTDLLQTILSVSTPATQQATTAEEIQWSLVYVERLKEALVSLKENYFDVILLNLSLQEKQGLYAVTKLVKAAPDVPIVVIADLNDKALALEVLEKGAQDYLIKGKIDSYLLCRSIEYAIERTKTLNKLRETQAQLQQLQEEFESKLEEKTNELKEKNQCLQREVVAHRRLEHELCKTLTQERGISEIKSNIISLVAHEYRTPLTTILSSAELLENYGHQLSQEKRKRHLQRIKTSVIHLNQLVSDVLLVSQAEVGKQEFNPTPLDVVGFCHQLVEEIQITTTSSHSIDFVSLCSCRDVYLDKKLLRQMLTNVLMNAIKYSPEGGNIQFELVCEQEKASSVTFRIRDQGIGIPPQDQAKLFDAFYRSSNVGKISGTGLGLAIVKKCVEFHGGQIAVDSEVARGTTFTITLPFQGPSSEKLSETTIPVKQRYCVTSPSIKLQQGLM
jgi:signal transduction histidine kinase